MLARINALLVTTEAAIVFPKDFVIPGSSKASSAIELARTIIRRAERWCVTLGREGLLPGDHLLAYMNRLADLLWLLARQAETLRRRCATNALGELGVAEGVAHAPLESRVAKAFIECIRASE
jgi:ATP:cob(I)alamin adenosyltransferase